MDTAMREALRKCANDRMEEEGWPQNHIDFWKKCFSQKKPRATTSGNGGEKTPPDYKKRSTFIAPQYGRRSKK